MILLLIMKLHFHGNDLNIDSIVEAEKLKAMNDLASTSKYDKDCKKPCCKGCKATDTIGLASRMSF